MHCSYPSCAPVAHKRVFEDLKRVHNKPKAFNIPSSIDEPNNEQYVLLAIIVLIILILKD
jgi:hypothetical protein